MPDRKQGLVHAVSQKAEVSSRIVERSKRVSGSESDVQSLPQVRMQRVVVRRANLAPAVQPAGAVQLGKQASGPPPGLGSLKTPKPWPRILKAKTSRAFCEQRRHPVHYDIGNGNGTR